MPFYSVSFSGLNFFIFRTKYSRNQTENLFSPLLNFICSFLSEHVKKHKMTNMISFIDPSMIGAIGCGNAGQRSRALAARFKNAKKGQYFLMPYNDV